MTSGTRREEIERPESGRAFRRQAHAAIERGKVIRLPERARGFPENGSQVTKDFQMASCGICSHSIPGFPC